MKFTLILEDEHGEQVDMTTTANKYMTSEIDGLYPPAGMISTSAYACTDGSYLNNAFIEKRNLVISFQMRGIGIEKRRHALYSVVKPSRYIKVYYRTANIDVYTEGYVETCTVSNFSNLTSGQISIICPDIYWYSVAPTYAYYSYIMGAFHFPFPESDEPFPLGYYNYDQSIRFINNGDEVGFTIKIEALKDGQLPSIYNEFGEYLIINSSVNSGEVVTITTQTGNKTVTLTRNGVDSNIINRLASGSTWFTLKKGENAFFLTGKNVKDFRVTIIHTDAFLGV
ncbi:MAG: phage tail family protein [Clostridium sp.]|nr:phage tail family protein [Clostridium sp.]